VVSKAKELHRQAPFDLIISRSLPHHAHLAGYWAAAALRSPWVAMINDPWDFSPFVRVYAERQSWTPTLNWRIWWRRVVASADRLCFPCRRLRDFCLQGSARKSGISIVPHVGGIGRSSHRVDDFLIVHAGKLGVNEPTGRSALALLEGLKAMFQMRPIAKPRTRLLLLGPEDPTTTAHVASLGLTENVVCTGLVSYEKSLEYIAQATLCVLVEADIKEGVFLPSKLCDYLASRKPLLALSPDVGTVADLALEGGGIRRVHPKDSAAVAAVLTEFFDAFEKSSLDAYTPSDSLVQRVDANRVIGDFLKSVRPLLSNTRRQDRVAEGAS
jgi:glycosyltransferase involved in cell wall biosynthesis